MKKHILAIILCVLCASFVLVLASCGGDTNTDSGSDCSQGHSFGDWTTETYASCTSAGLKVRVCQNCSEEEEEAIPAGHKFGEWEVVTEKTCVQGGLDRRVCSVCDFEEKEEYPSEGHKFGDWVVTEQGSCENDTKTERVCATCGEKETDTIPGDGHNYTEWGIGWDDEAFVKEPTCTEDGYVGRVCVDCGDEEREATPKKGHTWGSWSVVGSCADGATKTRNCTVCNEESTETTAAGEHANIVYEGAKTPVVGEDGSTGTKKCLSCGEVLAPAMVLRYSNIANQAIVSTNVDHWVPTTGLPYLVDGNRETGARTSYNHAAVRFVLEFSEDKNIDKVVIVVNGKGSTSDYKSVEEVTNLDFPVSVILYNKNGDIVEQQSFKTKDKIELVLEPTEEISKIAINVQCDYDHTRAIWEVETFATSILSACDVAGAHTWGDWTNVNQPVCNQDGSLTNGLETRTCSVCGKVEENVLTASHSFGAWDESNVACLTGGTKTRTCATCNYVESETVAAGGHIETERQDVIEPTFEADGSTGKLVCTKCGATVEEAKVITKYQNIAIGSTVTTDCDFWSVAGGYNLIKIVDGNRETALSSSPKVTTINDTITFATESGIKKVVLVVNGKGSTTDGGNFADITNKNYQISFVLYDENGNAVFTSEKYQTVDKTEIVVEIPENVNAKSMTITRFKQSYGTADNYLWDVEVIAGGDIVE